MYTPMIHGCKGSLADEACIKEHFGRTFQVDDVYAYLISSAAEVVSNDGIYLIKLKL